MSKSWHLVNYLKVNGPHNQTDLWTHFKPTKLFRSRTNMKDVLNNLRKVDRLNAVGVNYTYSGFKDHLYMVTSKKANFVKKEDTLELLKKREAYGIAQKQFFKAIEDAEQTLYKQYYATRPQQKAVFENKVRQKAKIQKGLRSYRKFEASNAAKTARRKNAERKKTLAENKKELVFGKNGAIRVKDQKTTQARKIAMEIRRVAGERKTVALMHAQMVAKGQRKAAPRLKLAADRAKAGPLGTPTRDAFEEKLAKTREKRAKELKKWRERRAKSRTRVKAPVEDNVQTEAAQDEVVKQALQLEEVTAAPPSQFREAAAEKLKAQRAKEGQKGEGKGKGKAKAKSVVSKPKKKLTPLQRKNQQSQKRHVKQVEAKLKEAKLKEIQAQEARAKKIAAKKAEKAAKEKTSESKENTSAQKTDA